MASGFRDDPDGLLRRGVERPVVVLVDDLHAGSRFREGGGHVRRPVLLDEGQGTSGGLEVLRVPVEDLRNLYRRDLLAARARRRQDEGARRRKERARGVVELLVEPLAAVG